MAASGHPVPSSAKATVEVVGSDSGAWELSAKETKVVAASAEQTPPASAASKGKGKPGLMLLPPDMAGGYGYASPAGTPKGPVPALKVDDAQVGLCCCCHSVCGFHPPSQTS